MVFLLVCGHTNYVCFESRPSPNNNFGYPDPLLVFSRGNTSPSKGGTDHYYVQNSDYLHNDYFSRLHFLLDESGKSGKNFTVSDSIAQ